jgi:DNA-binding beta-propeller fold protein YncE
LVYTANIADGDGPGTVSVINGATCNGHDINGCGQTPATDTSGCSHTPVKASVGGYPGSIAIDPAVGTAYLQTIDGVSVITLIH